LRKNYFHGRVARIKPFINQKIQMKFIENHLCRGSEFWKTVLFASGSDGRNYVWREPVEVLWTKKSSANDQTWWC
jgi:uncharacterized protein (DUF2342 family)